MKVKQECPECGGGGGNRLLQKNLTRFMEESRKSQCESDKKKVGEQKGTGDAVEIEHKAFPLGAIGEQF